MRESDDVFLVICEEVSEDREQNTYVLGAFTTSYLAKEAVGMSITEDKALGYVLTFKTDTEAVLDSIDGGSMTYRIVKMELIDYDTFGEVYE